MTLCVYCLLLLRYTGILILFVRYHLSFSNSISGLLVFGRLLSCVIACRIETWDLLPSGRKMVDLSRNFVFFYYIHDLNTAILEHFVASSIWHKMTFQIRVYCWVSPSEDTWDMETAKACDDNVEWKRRYTESFYPPQAAECGMRECKAGIDLGIEMWKRGCNGIAGWKLDWGGTEEQMETEREKRWEAEGWDLIWTKSSLYTMTQTRPEANFYFKN